MTEEMLFELVSSAPESQRAALLDRECAGKPELRARLEALLAAHFSVSPQPNLTVDHGSDDATRSIGGQLPATTSHHSEKAEAAGTLVAGKYTLVEPIGEGGMGSVWRAKQSEPVKRFVALKLIKAGMDSKQVLVRFEAERQALALMDHPNIAKVLDGGLHNHRPYFVMELVKGVPITEYCDAHKLTPQQRLELFVQACHAIQHAHQKGIIHRDIKPSNVMVALYDDKPVVKVIDFGVAKATGGTLTEQTLDTGFGGIVGTPQYMSPEQATFNNLDIDTRSDVYALGVLLYELLAGSPPFSGKELQKKGLLEILRVVREEEPPRPSTKLSTADALPSLSASRGTEPKKLTGLLRNELDWIVMKALEKDRSRRYETANGFAADVQRYLSGESGPSASTEHGVPGEEVLVAVSPTRDCEWHLSGGVASGDCWHNVGFGAGQCAAG
jgi:eukaryotic-like serine/threonine-protein kinase